MTKAASRIDRRYHVYPKVKGGVLWFGDAEQIQGKSLKEMLPAGVEKWVWVDEISWKAFTPGVDGKNMKWLQLDEGGDFGRHWFDRFKTDAFNPAIAISSCNIGELTVKYDGAHIFNLSGNAGQGFAVIAGKPAGGRIPPQTILAGDHLGSRRLFYHCTDRWIAWSTDLKQLVDLRLSLEEDQILPDFSHIDYYLKYLHFPAWNALPMAGVGCLPPASFLCSDENQFQLRSYWTPPFEPMLTDFTHTRDLVKKNLAAAVKQDVGDGSEPVGLLLSGGLDSTLLLALLRTGERSVWTYTVGFDGEADESSDAEFAAGHFQSRHQTLTLRPQDVEPLLWKVTRCTGCPSGNPSSLALYLAAETARGNVKQLFSGIGSDEIFCGHRKHVLARYWPAARPLHNLIRYCFRLRREYRRFGAGPVKHYDDLYAFFTEDQIHNLLKKRQPAPNSYNFRGIVNASREQTVFLTDLFLWLAGGVLPQSTAVAAACEISLKTPFCSAAMVELAARIPLHLKVRGNTGKWILRQAFFEALPSRVLKKRRRGFNLPLGKWLRGPLAPLLERYLNPDVLSSRALLEPESVFRMIQTHRSGGLDLSLPLWALISLEVWQRIFIDGQTNPLESDR